MDGHNLQFADFITVTATQTESLALVQSETNLGRAFINVIKQSTVKIPEGSNQRVQKAITFECYKFVERMINPNSMVLIGNNRYGNLEVLPIVGSKTKIQVTGVL